MKRMNKKGFTLAELLIVIAIIAILIAIAIPAFSGALDSARIQTDHANMRSAYAIAQTATMLETVDVTPAGGTLATEPADKTKEYYFQKDGTMTEGTAGNNYLTQITVTDTSKCAESIVCQTASHAANQPIFIDYDSAKTKWVVCVGTPVGP